MKKNFILFALMVFLPVLAFAQSVTLNITGATTVTYNGQDQKPTYRASSANGSYSTGYYGTIEWQSNAFTYTYTYNGGAATDLTEETEFVNAGTYVITASRKYHTRGSWRENYPNTWQTATDEVIFTIEPKSVSSVSFSVSPVVFEYNGSYQKPKADAVDPILGQLVEGVDYEDLDPDNYADNKNPGTASATLKGIGNYEGEKTVYFTILSAGSETPGASIAGAEVTAEAVEYNGTSTAARITSVTIPEQVDNTTVQRQLFLGADYKIVGYVEQAAFDAYNEDEAEMPTILAAPNHVGDWYVLIAPAAGLYGFEDMAYGAFTVNPRALKIDLLEIHKTYGDPDPTLTFNDIDKWASINWAPGDGPTNTTISNFKFKRIDAGEQAYDGDSQLKYTYSLEAVDPSIEGGFIATTIINGVEYNNYTVGVGQSSSLLIDKAGLELNVTNYWKKFKATDPNPFEYTVVDETKLKNGDKLADVKATVTREEGEDVNAHVEKVDNKDVVVLNDNEVGYAFEGVSNNYEISFNNAFAITPTNDLTGITVTFNPASYVYNGLEQKPEPIVKLGNETIPYSSADYTDNVHVGTAKCTVTLTGSYTGTVSGTFAITKAPLTIKANSYTRQPGDEEPEYAWTYNGFVNGEGPNNAKDFKAPSGITKTAIPGSAGAFKLSVNEDAEAADYDISYQEGAVGFGETVLLVVAEDAEKTFGEKDPEEFEVTVYDAETDEEVEPTMLFIGGKQVYTISREEGEDAGEYDIVFDGPTVLPEGYILVYVDGEFTINRKTVYLRGDAVSKEYGEANPTFDASVWEDNAKWSDEKKAEEGVVNPDFYYVGVEGATWNTWTQAWVLPSENVTPANGGYPVTVTVRYGWNAPNGITTSGNYEVVADNDNSGKFTITAAPLTIVADDKTQMYGDEPKPLTATITGLKRNDRLVVGRDYTISRAEGNDVGEYVITVKAVENSDVLKNYTATWTNGKYTITTAALEVVAQDQGIYYGDAIDPYNMIVTFKESGNELTRDQFKDWLSLSTTVTKVGANKDAYTLNNAGNKNFTIDIENDFTNAWLTIAPLKVLPLGAADLAKLTKNPLKQVLEDHEGCIVDVLLPSDRSMAANDWYSWVLPFAVTPRMLSRDNTWGYAAVDVLDEAKSVGNSIVFKLTVDEIPANTPFLVKVDEDITKEDMGAIKFEGVKIPEADYLAGSVSVGKDVQFVGLYEPVDGLTASDRYLTRNAAIDPVRAFYVGDDKAKLSQTRAYLHFASAEQSANARIYVQEADGSTTAIDGVNAEAEAEAADGWFTVTGVKLEGEPTVSGTYIFNGKKVFFQAK